MPLVTPAQMAQKHQGEKSTKPREDRAKDAIQQVNMAETYANFINEHDQEMNLLKQELEQEKQNFR